MQTVDLRQVKGEAIARQFGWVKRIDEDSYRVHSQAGDFEYDVLSTELGWLCQCADHMYRGLKCKHIIAVELSFILRKIVAKEPITIQAVNAQNCPKCGSANLVRHGLRHNKYGDLQRFSCKDCGKRFVVNLGFEKMQATPQAITGAMQLYFTGESFRNVQNFLRLQGVNVSHVCIYKWIGKYVKLMEKYLDKITPPNVSDTWRTDELYLKIKKDKKYLFAMMDDETRFRIAQMVSEHKGTDDVRPMFRESRRVAGKKPKTLISDGAHNFSDANNKEWWTMKKETRTNHIRDIHLSGEIHNNKMERQNGEWRDREKVFRSLKRDDTPILAGMQIFHNYIRPHMGLPNEITPAEAAGIKVEGQNKWITIIQNASRKTNIEN